jgi:hypothetical protein
MQTRTVGSGNGVFVISGVEMKDKILNNSIYKNYKNKTNTVVLVRKRTIPTERPPLVGEVSVNFSG